MSATYDYDGVGNLIRITNRKLQITAHAYDALNRLTRIQDHDGRITTYAYDLAGNLAQMSDTQSGDILMSYDVLNRLTEVVTSQGTIAYTYDAIGRRLTRTLSGGDVTTYTYDKADRLKTVTLRGRTATYTYDLAERLTQKVLPNGIKAAYQYDDADRVLSISYKKTDESSIETVSYSYDDAGQRTSRGDGQVPPKDTTFSATYDEANRLTAITLSGEAFTLSYDANGNLASKSGPTSGTTTYTWNSRDQLIALSGPSGSATFRYDALGRRIEKAVNGVTTGFLYDGAQAIAELKGTAVDTIYHTGLLIDEVLAGYGATGNRTLLNDMLMSVIAQANDDQSIGNFYAYSAYGEATSLGPDGGNPLQYTGRENDGTGLYYYRARYYDPVLKRFISEDPIGLRGGVNLIAYVAGNPVSFNDPRGLDYPLMYPMMNSALASPSGSSCGCPPRLPDYVQFTLGVYVFNVTGTFSRSGDSFLGGGVMKQWPNPLNFGGSAAAGWLNQCQVPSGQQVNNFIGGFGMGFAAAYGVVGGGMAWSPGGGTATQLGVGAGVNFSPATIQVNQGSTGISW